LNYKKQPDGLCTEIGGSSRVDQMINYKHCQITDINVQDGGFGEVLKSPFGAGTFHLIKRYVRQELNHLRFGESVPRDRQTIIVDVHNAYVRKDLAHRFECTISSNVIEHSPNAIWLLLNLYFMTAKNGYQFHAIPHYKYTYDCFREPTHLEHFISDFSKKINQTDGSHRDDYMQSVIVKHGWQKSFHEKYPVAYPYMHFHVFNEHNTQALFSYMFEDVSTELLKTDKFSDVVVFFRNQLRTEFMKTHQKTIDWYISTRFHI
jgi:hypothetical protein